MIILKNSTWFCSFFLQTWKHAWHIDELPADCSFFYWTSWGQKNIGWRNVRISSWNSLIFCQLSIPGQHKLIIQPNRIVTLLFRPLLFRPFLLSNECTWATCSQAMLRQSRVVRPQKRSKRSQGECLTCQEVCHWTSIGHLFFCKM